MEESPMTMDIHLEDFAVIQRSSNLTRLMPAETLRVNDNSISISSDLVEQFRSPEYKTRAYIGISYNEKAEAILLQKDTDTKECFTFAIDEKTGTARLTHLPIAIKAAHMPKGTYTLYPGIPMCFILTAREDFLSKDDPKVRYFIEDDRHIEAGDIVSWIARPGHDKNFVATGEVRLIKTRKNDEGKSEEWLNIYPISKNWLDAYPSRVRNVKSRKINIILREKGDGKFSDPK